MPEHRTSDLDAVDRAIIRVIGEHQDAGVGYGIDESQIWVALSHEGFAEGVGPGDVGNRVARLVELGYVVALPMPRGATPDPPLPAYVLAEPKGRGIVHGA